MSDYLSNLAARSRDQADVIQPRPVSLFAPASRASGWPPVEQADDLESVDREQRLADPRAPAFQAVAPQADRRAKPQPTAPSLAPPIGWSPLVLPTDRPALPPAADVAVPSSRAGEAQRRTALEPAAERVIVERQIAPAPATERVIVERQIAPAPAAERVIVERLFAPAPALAATHAETAPIESVVERIVTPAAWPAPATSVPPHMTPPPPSAPAQIIVKPRVAPAPIAPAPAQIPTRPEPATPEPVPTIQVTIGRIEVRATPPPSQPARAARPAAPAMSLDEYLRSRNGGGR